MLPKPKLPRRAKKKARFYTLSDVAKIITASQGEERVFYWLAAETGLRAGEIAGLKLTADRLNGDGILRPDVCSEIEKAVSKLECERSSALVGSLLAIEEKGSGATIS